MTELEHGVWASVGRKTSLTPLETTFRGHALKAWKREPTLDDEAAILAAGLDPKTKTIKSHTAILQEYIRRCVPKTDFGLTAAKLDDKRIRRDTDFLWMLYVWFDVQACLPTESRQDLVEAVQGKRIGSSTVKARTQSLPPVSSDVSLDSEE